MPNDRLPRRTAVCSLLGMLGAACGLGSGSMAQPRGAWPPETVEYPTPATHRCAPETIARSVPESDGGADPGESVRRPMFFVKPLYPPEAQARGVTGWVTLEFTVNDYGRPCDLRVVAAAPPGVFDEAAIASVVQWLYEPGRDAAGTRVSTRNVRGRVVFRISDSSGSGATPP